MGNITYWVGPAQNLCPNSSFEADSNADGVADSWQPYTNDVNVPALSRVAGIHGAWAQRASWVVANANRKGICLLGGAVDGIQGGWKAFATFLVSFYARASGSNVGMTMATNTWNTQPTTDTYLANPPLSASWQRYVRKIVWGAGIEAVGGLFLSIVDNSQTSGTLDFDAVQVEPGDTLHNYQPT